MILHRNQRGFSLVETLFALLLFSITITALMRYQLVLADGFQQQWQQRSAWRNARQLLQGNPLEGGQAQLHQESGPEGCQLLIAKTISPAGRRAELTQLRCPAVEN
ncbi:prepilin-type N-terminal cleavage/methylation domain-containing protein [Erwinia sp. JUb26]|uniref:prepilin-type N-terminal cleavage/methylation domain-containing protein n=1 Tax=Erwinia sp. JUb26 TaxID=2485126 RepID=UPI000F49EB64|nr:prepilin-type N-terminal cleavage/methylation domain-containing protein [Erwinia sp. JUb26]ROR13205.1 prepilin peptidase dependent protein C [Erwinia sp. JUb26]